MFKFTWRLLVCEQYDVSYAMRQRQVQAKGLELHASQHASKQHGMPQCRAALQSTYSGSGPDVSRSTKRLPAPYANISARQQVTHPIQSNAPHRLADTHTHTRTHTCSRNDVDGIEQSTHAQCDITFHQYKYKYIECVLDVSMSACQHASIPAEHPVLP